MRQVGDLVTSLDRLVGARQSRLAVPVLTGRYAGVALVPIEQPRYAGTCQIGSGTRVELAPQRVTPPRGRPRGLGDHGDAAFHLDDFAHAVHQPRRGGVEAFHLPAKYRAAGHAGVEHAGQIHVQAEDDFAADLRRVVESRH